MSAVTRRVLMLHGHSQNANIFRKRISALRKHCESNIEFVFVDAPHILQAADLIGSTPDSTSITSPDPPRGWWNGNLVPGKAVGLEESLLSLRDVLEGQKFDGVFGFSQGAALAALLAALLERPQVYPAFLIDGKTPHPPFQFCVSISGFKINDALASSIYEPSFSTPTLHIIGRTDILVIEERSRALVAVSDNARVEEHEGGHFVPQKTSWRNFLRSYLLDPLVEYPSPGMAGSSNPNSGAATPTEIPRMTPRY